jgi:hypothetical protein
MLFAYQNGVLDSKFLSSKAMLYILTKNYNSSEKSTENEKIPEEVGIGITAIDLTQLDLMFNSSSKATISQLYLRNLINFLQTKIAK